MLEIPEELTAEEKLTFLLDNRINIPLAVTLFNHADDYTARDIYYAVTDKYLNDTQWETLEEILKSELNW